MLPLLLAPFIGSFLGVLIHRLPRGQPVALARSACEGCGRLLAAWELVPVFSFLALRGLCRCRLHPIGGQHLAVELAALVVAAWAVLASPDPFSAWVHCGLGWTLLALGWIDWQHHRLPDVLTLPLLLGGLFVTLGVEPDRIGAHAAGALAGYAVFRLLAIAFRALRGREGLGEGDAKLLAAAGAWLGWEPLNAVILLAACSGLLLAAAEHRRQGGRLSVIPIAFGPCLALAFWLVRLHAVWLPAWLVLE